MYTPIVGTLGYVLRGDEVLLIHRNARKNDQHLGKYNGLGGKLEANEDVVAGFRRELFEESGLIAEKLQLRGTVSWPGFGIRGENWLGFIFRVDEFSGELKSVNPEGELDWYPISQLSQLPMWEGDRYWLPLVFDKDPRIFHGIMPYQDGKPRSWSYSRI